MGVTVTIGNTPNRFDKLKSNNTQRTRVLMPHEKVIEQYGLKLTQEDFLPKKKLGPKLRYEILLDFLNKEVELKNIKSFTSSEKQKTFNINFFDYENFVNFDKSYSNRLIEATIDRIKKDDKNPAEFQIDYILSFNNDPTDANCKHVIVR